MAKTSQLTDKNGINIYPITIGENVFINNKRLDRELNKFIIYEDSEDDIEDVEDDLKEETRIYLLDRSNHTGTQGIDTIDGLRDILDDKAGIGLVTEEVSGLMSAADKVKLDEVEEALEDVGRQLTEQDEAIAGKATTTTYTVPLPTGWIGDAAPYTKQVTVSGLLETDTPIVDLVPSSDYATAQNELKAYANIYRFVTGDGTLTAYASKAPTVALNIMLKVVR